MKKVIFFSSDNNMISGAFQSMTKLCQLINRSGRYETLVVLPQWGEGEKLLKSADVKYTIIKSYHWIVRNSDTNKLKNVLYKIIKEVINFKAVYDISKLIDSEKPDIIHSNTSYVYVGQKAALKKGITSVWQIRELLEEDQNCHFWDCSCINLMNTADACVAISECVMEKYASCIDKIQVIYNGIDREKYYFERNFDFVRSKDSISFLCVGNMSGGKGQDLILNACGQLVESGITNFNVRFVGSGVREREYRRIADEFNLRSNVEFCGVTNNVTEYYRTSDVLLMTSKAEAFGRTTVEAMMAGCLIIGSNSGATPELLRDNTYGLLFEKNSVKELYDKMKLVISDRSCFALAEKGQKFAIDSFTAEKNADSVMALYDRLLSERK